MTKAFLEELTTKLQHLGILEDTRGLNKEKLFGAMKAGSLSVKVFEQLLYQECEFRTNFASD